MKQDNVSGVHALDHSSRMQSWDCGFVVADLGQHLTSVLAQRWRQAS